MNPLFHSRALSTMASSAPSSSQARQQGTVLIVVLIMLVVASLIGVSSSQLTLQAERSTRYERDYQIAYQSAEAALIDAEYDIRGPNTHATNRVVLFSPESTESFVQGCGNSANNRGLCLPNETGKPVWLQVDFTATGNNRAAARFGEFTGRSYPHSEDDGVRSLKSELAPRYIIEVIKERTTGSKASLGEENYFHRITAVGFGPTRNTQVVLQAIVRKEK